MDKPLLVVELVVGVIDAVDASLEHFEAQHRALHPGGTDGNADLLEQIFLADRLDLVERFPSAISVRIEADAWLTAQPRPENRISEMRSSETRTSIRTSSPHSGLTSS